MKLVYRFIVITGLFLFSPLMVVTPIVAISSSETPQDTQLSPSSEYLEVLQTADTFLWAWVTRDSKGLNLISNRLRAQVNDELWLRQFMVGLSNPHHQAFEIGTGKKLSSDRYVFPVTLYELYTGETTGLAYSGTLEIIKQGKDWRINMLPKNSD